MNLKSTTANGLNFRIINSLMEFWGVRLTWLDCKFDFFFSDLEDSLPDAMKEMFDMEFDFPPRTHCLSRWYYAFANDLLPKYNCLHGKFIIMSPSVYPC